MNSSIDEFVQRQKQTSAQNQSQLSTAQADDSPASPRGSTTKIGTIHSELPAYDLEEVTSPTKVGRIELWLDAWEVDGAERTYLTALRGKQIPASYSQQDGESSARNDYTWLRQYWNKTDLGSVAVKDRAPKGDKSGSIDTTLNIGISSDKTGNAGLSVDMEVPDISREEKSDIGNTIEQGYQYAEKTFNDDSTDDPVTFYSLGHGVVSKEPDSYGLCTAPPGYPDQDGPTLLEAEMKAKFEYHNPIPDVGGTGSTTLETTGSITIDGKLACLDEPVQP
ncbi:hypothetical protein Natpe_3251 [Natrinema pellirubrum DSM 15624]|uniref:Uncharacterized protein n=1 Tax=Natrinema pellirubrum (strain DSM 15624 / CIP 106293 / JCM 10476 / NCIMB 786 / 157) TaxID=797303 RepID=L0JRN2_NATP1|nr:hypothetical protein Natpe_3251 [Natrinema pellirubrum DSM 15624]